MKAKVNLIISVFIITIIVLSTVCSTYAITQKDLNETKDQMNEAEKELEAIHANLTAERKNILQLVSEIDEVEYELTKIQNNLKILEGEISEIEVELEKKVKEYDEKYEAACNRVVAHYKYGKITYLDVLLKSKSVTDFLSRYYLMKEVVNLDENFLDELEQERTQIENEKQELEVKKAKVVEERKEVQAKKIVLSNKKADKQKMIEGLSAEEAAAQKELDALSEKYAQQEREWSKLAAESGNSGSYSGGKLQFPCPGYTRVSSRFGTRGSPLSGGSSYHKGIDLAAPKGSSIYSGESGKVIAVYTGCVHNYGKAKSCGCGGGFGNYVMISHGGGLVTVYAHCTSINVSKGQTVAKGQVIATVGSTGASTGNHLHFGTLLNGTYVDPAPYIGL